MPPDIRSTGEESGYAARSVTKEPPWHGLVTFDLLINNLTSGLFLAAGLSELTRPRIFRPVATVAYPIALGLLSLELLLLVLDLGDRSRFHYMLRRFKPGSPMSFGVWALTIYALVLTVLVGTELSPTQGAAWAGIRTATLILGLGPALAAAVYKGVLLSTTAQPGWRDARWLGGYLASAAVLLGCAILLALSVGMRRESAAAALRWALVALLGVHLVPLILLLTALRTVLARTYPARRLGRIGVLGLGMGIVLPLGLLLCGESPVLVLAAVLFLLLGSLVIRWVIVCVPHASHLGSAPH
jgi:Ni/Fe-hydrogenase subunit HybB-like protein